MRDRHAERAALVDALRRNGIHDERVLSAIGHVPRERFVGVGHQAEAYVDSALPIAGGQSISQPWVVARMTELLRLRPEDRVLEVGTGWGYQSAVLAEIAREVESVERVAELAEGAAARLAELGYENVHIHLGDGSLGWPDNAPYDRVIVTAACPAIPPALAEQITADGRIVAPVGDADAQVLTVRHADGHEEEHEAVRFVPLLGRAGFQR